MGNHGPSIPNMTKHSWSVIHRLVRRQCLAWGRMGAGFEMSEMRALLIVSDCIKRWDIIDDVASLEQ